MYKNVKQGWYKLVNPQKFIPPADKHMKSFNESEMKINYKSSLELKAFRYADYNKHIKKFSVEPFAIKYLKPTDGKYHRYYIDLFLEFTNGQKFIIEVKSSNETKPPKAPRKNAKNKEKAQMNYQRALQTYAVNQAKWKAAKEFAAKNKMKFVILTEEVLN